MIIWQTVQSFGGSSTCQFKYPSVLCAGDSGTVIQYTDRPGSGTGSGRLRTQKNGEPIELTSVEYRIMELFMKHPGKVFTKQQIYEQGWGDTYVVADNNIMVCISKLRAKLDEDPAAYIRTIRGLGYRLEK